MESKVLYPKVFTSNFVLLMNSESIASSYSEMDEHVGIVLFNTLARPVSWAIL